MSAGSNPAPSAIRRITVKKKKNSVDSLIDKKTATVGDVIRHLKKNFKPTDKLCFWDEGGAHMECISIPRDYIGKVMFRYIKDKKKKFENVKEAESFYEFVNDDDVLVY